MISTIAFASHPLTAADAPAASISANSSPAVVPPVPSVSAVAVVLTATPTANELMAINTELEILLMNTDTRIKDIFDLHPTWGPLYALMYPGRRTLSQVARSNHGQPMPPINPLDPNFHTLYLNAAGMINVPNGVVLNAATGSYLGGGVAGCGYCNDP